MMRRDLIISIVSIIILLVLGILQLPGEVGEFITRVQRPVTSTREADEITAGYYEDLLDATAVRGATPTGLVGTVSSARSEVPDNWPRLHDTEGVVWDVDPYQRFLLRPGSQLSYKGAELDINALGYRDRPFDVDPEAGTRRIVLVGSSIAMGSGVPVDQTFENLFEDRLKADGYRIEILNLAVAGYRGTQLVDVMLEQVPGLQPDAVLLVLNDLTVNPKWSRHLERLMVENRDLKYPFLNDLVERAGVTPDMDAAEMSRRLAPFQDEVNAWWLSRSVDAAQEIGVPIAILVLPQPATVEPFRKRVKRLHGLLTELNVPVISLYGAYDDAYDQTALWLRPWDRHPNSDGHTLIHKALEDAMIQRRDLRDVILGGESEQETRDDG